MGRLIKLVAAAVGGGFAVGAGIRVGKAMALAAQPASDAASDSLALQLDRIEARLHRLESNTCSSADPLTDERRAESRPGCDHRIDPAVPISAPAANVESPPKAEIDCAQQQILESIVDAVQTRVLGRVSRLEQAVADNSAEMRDLRDLSLRTEESLHKLLNGLDRLILRNSLGNAAENRAAAPAFDDSPRQCSGLKTPGPSACGEPRDPSQRRRAAGLSPTAARPVNPCH